MKTTSVCCALLCLFLPSCELQEEPGDTSPSQEAKVKKELPSKPSAFDYEFDRWHDDFPYALHVPPKRVGLWYDRNAQQALEKIVNNVSGLCTKPAWMMSKEFFDRHLDRSAELLIEKLDETQRRRDGYDHAENLLAAIARQKTSVFAKAIVRTASHSHPGIRRAAFRALLNAGDEAAVMEVGKKFTAMNRSEQTDWVKAAARHLSDKNLFPLFRDMLTKQKYAGMQAYVFDEVMKLPAKRAAKLFDPIWLSMAKDLQLHVAGVMHAAGDERGTVRLRHALKLPVEIVKRKIVAVQYTHLRDRQPQRPLTAYAKAHEMPSASIDGNDVLVVRKVAQEMVERARQNEGPSLIVADTYRWREHCGPSYDNDLGYRTMSEFKHWEHLCPVKKLREHLISLGILNDKIEASLTETIETEINEAFDSARKAPFPSPESAGLRVYA